jgi:hypothetical protein
MFTSFLAPSCCSRTTEPVACDDVQDAGISLGILILCDLLFENNNSRPPPNSILSDIVDIVNAESRIDTTQKKWAKSHVDRLAKQLNSYLI